MPLVIIKLLFFISIYGRANIPLGDDPYVIHTPEGDHPIELVIEGTSTSEVSSAVPTMGTTSTATPPAVESTSKHYGRIEDWLPDAWGVCPIDQPDSPWWRVYFSPSIEVDPRTPGVDPMHEIVNVAWNEFHRSGLAMGEHRRFAFAWQMGYPNTWGNGFTEYWVNWDDFTITYQNTAEGAYLSDEYKAMHQATADEATAYLRWLENTYNSKCPND